MKKKFFSIALALAGLMGTSAMAQTQPTTQISQGTTTQTKASKAKDRPNPFDGLNLTEKQQAELKALREGVMAEKKKIAAEEKSEKKDMREQREKDSKEYLAKLKEILTPEQYVTFLENSYLSSQGMFGNRGMRQDKKGMRPDRGDRGMRGDRR